MHVFSIGSASGGTTLALGNDIKFGIIESLRARRSILCFLWVSFASSLPVVNSQTLTDAPVSVQQGALAAITGLHNAVNIDPAKLDQYYDAAQTHRALATMPPPASAIPRRRHHSRPAARPLSHRALIVHIPPMPSPAYRRTFSMLQSRPDATDRYDDYILKYSEIYGLDPRLLKAVMAAESEFDPGALSPAKARGLMQLLPETAEEMGIPRRRLADPESNIMAGASYIYTLFQIAWKTFHLPGSDFHHAPLWLLQRVIAGYHAGPKFMTGSWWHSSTRDYIKRVIMFYRSKITDLRRMPEYRTPGPLFSTIFSPEFVRY